MRTRFTGVGTALITPFTAAGAVDEAAVRRLARRQAARWPAPDASDSSQFARSVAGAGASGRVLRHGMPAARPHSVNRL